MSFTGNEGQSITLAVASDLTENYRNANDNATGLILGHFIGINKINLILAQEGCVGIRTYYAIDEGGKKAIVMVGVDADENDLDAGVILDRSVNCPPSCGVANDLNS